MENTTIFNYFKIPISSQLLSTTLLLIKGEIYKPLVEELRQFYWQDLDAAYDRQMRIMPRFSVSGNFTLIDGKLTLASYSGYIALEIPYLNELDRLSVKNQLHFDPFVTACFTNALGVGLVIIAKTETGPEQHQQVFHRMASYFEQITGIHRVAVFGDSIDHSILISEDPELYLNLQATPFPKSTKTFLAKSF